MGFCFGSRFAPLLLGLGGLGGGVGPCCWPRRVRAGAGGLAVGCCSAVAVCCAVARCLLCVSLACSLLPPCPAAPARGLYQCCYRHRCAYRFHSLAGGGHFVLLLSIFSVGHQVLLHSVCSGGDTRSFCLSGARTIRVAWTGEEQPAQGSSEASSITEARRIARAGLCRSKFGFCPCSAVE